MTGTGCPRTAGRQRGARHADAGARRSRRHGFRRGSYLRQHHPSATAAIKRRRVLAHGVTSVFFVLLPEQVLRLRRLRNQQG